MPAARGLRRGACAFPTFVALPVGLIQAAEPERPADAAEGWTSAVEEGENGTYYFTTRNHGLIEWQRERWQVYSTENGPPVDGLRLSYRGRNGVLWIVPVAGGQLIRSGAGRFVTYSVEEGLLWSVLAASDDNSGANVGSFDQVGIKSLRPTMVTGRMNDT